MKNKEQVHQLVENVILQAESKNRRPDVQVYVPRARRQQPGQNTSENQASPDRPDVTPKVTPVRQRKKEVEHYVPRGRREQQNRERDSAFQQVTNSSTIEVPHTNSMNTGPAKNIHKKIKVTDNVPDERYQTDIKSVSISEQSVYKNEERCAENKFCDNEDVVQRSNSSKTDMESSKYDVLDNSKNVPTHTSIYEPAAIGTSKCKKLDANNEEVIVENTQHLPELSTEQKFDKVTDTDLEDVTSLRSASADLTLHHTIGTTNVSSKESALDKLPESQEDHSASHKHCGEQTASKNNVNCNNKTTVQESQILSDDFNDKIEVPESTSDIIGYNVSKMSSLDGAGEMELSCEIENMKDDQDGNYSHGDELTNLESEDFAKCSNDSTTLPEETDQAQKVTSQTEKYSEVTSNADNPELNSTSLVKSSENVTKSLTADNVLDVQAESNFNDTSETSSEDKATTEIAPGVLPDSNETNAKSNCDQTNEESEILRDQTDIIENSMDTEAMDTRQSCGGQESGDFEDKDISENKVEQSAHTHSSKSVQEAVREDAESENVTIYNNKSEGMEAKTSDQSETVNIDSSQSKEEEEDEDSWDKMFDDDGECLDPTAMEELTKTVGKVKIQKSKKINYLDYQPKDKSNFDFTQYEHIIEIYDFPVEFVTRDLIIAFQSFMSRGFDLKWVDDTHALGIFSSAIAAKDALQLVHPLLKVCPLSQASKQSQNKAKRCTEFLQPYKPRPETSAMAARRLVAGALGIATGVSREKREMERKQLKEAKAKKRQERQNRENIWEYGKCAMDEES
ncbi:dentin sialophosphoprotein-like isoform X2 [Mercenaria mercenaria]|uniref:dentin sialophosphoprotein-like isoform X2 n=1 Tax=Mercenaria mercenaria TaxID=6596 RepID=UPI00234FA2D3|nr:dentin sialophosphoprotein-like isoform X2 [Mercenaria mercenaria]